MNKDINQWSQNCHNCQVSKIHRHTKAPLTPIPIPSGRFEHIHIDIVGPLAPSDGQQYVLTTIDRYTRWPEAFPMPDMRAETVAKIFLQNYISRFGVPITMSTDQGSQFESKLMEELNRLLGTHRIRTTSYNPKSNGLIERVHRQLKASIRCLEDTDNWTTLLPLVLLGIRTTFRPDLKGTPSNMVYGQDLKVPGQMFVPSSPVNDNLTDNFAKTIREHFNTISSPDTRVADNERAFIPKNLDNCTHVYILVKKVQPSLSNPYEGPYEVVKRHTKFFTVRRFTRIGTQDVNVSIDRLKPAFGVPEATTERPHNAVNPQQANKAPKSSMTKTNLVSNLKTTDVTPTHTMQTRSMTKSLKSILKTDKKSRPTKKVRFACP